MGGMMTGKSVIYSAFVSDLHLGHRRVPTTLTLASLNKAFPPSAETGELDIIYLGGDIYDRLLTLPDDQVNLIRLWIISLLKLCKRYNILLRVLAGTGSHDRGQGKEFTHLNEITGIGADCRYIDTLSIEHIDSLNIDVLYIPDEWRPATEATWVDVKQRLMETGIERVDYTIMHGVFPFQLPFNLNIQTHDPDKYLGITKQYISIGHHHVMRQQDRIMAQGSFDRLAHGEEGAKGHIRIKATTTLEHDKDIIRFIENREACVFKTINLADKSESEMDVIIKALPQYPKGSHLRFIVEKHSALVPKINVLKDQQSDYICTTKVMTDDSSHCTLDKSSFKPNYTVVEIKPENIRERLITRLIEEGHPPALLKTAEQLLEEMQ